MITYREKHFAFKRTKPGYGLDEKGKIRFLPEGYPVYEYSLTKEDREWMKDYLKNRFH